MKAEIATHVFEAFKDAEFIRPEKETASGSEIASVLSTTRVRDLIEFGRAVHAEMAALTSAARTGAAVQDACLYVTTFPCHLCARLIVAAGIKRVVYIYPYSKSLTAALHDDAVRTDYRILERDEEPGEPSRVRFEPFVGVSPRGYPTYFAAPARKLGGRLLAIDQTTRIPRRVYEEYTIFGAEAAYVDRENVLIADSENWLPTEKPMFDDLRSRAQEEAARARRPIKPKEDEHVRSR